MKRNFFYLIVSTVCFLVACGPVTSASFQVDADVYRLNDLQYSGELIEAYRAKKGQYPFQDEAQELPLYAVIASPEQVAEVQKLPFQHVEKTTTQFFSELESVFGQEIQERYDPQFEPDRKPNFYIYMVQGDRYIFAVHVSQSFNFAQAVGPGYNEVEISNDPRDDTYASETGSLFRHQQFIDAQSAPVSKSEFFNARRRKFENSYPSNLKVETSN